ncbi:hypothetical protein R1sor_004971 [Riccia sorocarpa]|uniref:Uncharacterized protein n=1 Tax=Riccia sorocarpa TaxID=122646 RepID=A0ABD3HI71_9MARC
MEQTLLEDWLRVASSPSSSPSPEPATQSTPALAANAVVQAWAEIRSCVQNKILTDAQRAALELLFRHRRSLHYADSQVKLLLALMTEVTCSDPSLMGYARKFAILGVLAWVRKRYSGIAVTTSSSQKQSPEKLVSIVQTLQKALDDYPTSEAYTCEGILLLGVVCSLASVPQDLRTLCCSLIGVYFEARKSSILRGSIAEALAGGGYAMSVCHEQHLASIFRPMMQLWTTDPGSASSQNAAEGSYGYQRLENPPLKDVIMILHLLDYLGSQFLSRYSQQESAGIQVLCEETLEVPVQRVGQEVQSAGLMASFGLLRSLYRSNPGKRKGPSAKAVNPKLLFLIRSLEDFVHRFCENVVPPGVSMSTFGSSILHGGAYADGVFSQTPNMLLIRCVALGVSRCPTFPGNPSILRCLVLCVFEDVLRLDPVYSAYLNEVVIGLVGGRQNIHEVSEEVKVADDLDAVLVAFQVHTESFVFQEVGALARALCEQYRKSGEYEQSQTVKYVWEFAKKLQSSHRLFVATSGKPPSHTGLSHYARTMEKFLESVFLTVVVFYDTAVVKDSGKQSSALEFAALALDTFSCVEYFRHLQIKEYVEVIRTAVARVSDSEAGSVYFVNKFPHYNDIIQLPGPSNLKVAYAWDQDEVQSSRVLFYFRVLPVCLDNLPDAVFVERVAPVLFLFLQHPSEQMGKAVHSLFGAFLFSKVETEAANSTSNVKIPLRSNSGPEPDLLLREQLVVYYAERAVELFPDVTPFKGLVSGINSIARYLPAGSPVVVYCLSRLAKRTQALYTEEVSAKSASPPQETSSRTESASVDGRKVSIEQMGVAEKLQALLLHLILIVDLQVLPELLKLVASLVLGLPVHQQTAALEEVYDIVAVSDDYTRKPLIIPWLQTLSFHIFNNQRQVKRAPGSRL